MSNEQDTTLNFRWLDNPEKVGERLFTFDEKQYSICSEIIRRH